MNLPEHFQQNTGHTLMGFLFLRTQTEPQEVYLSYFKRRHDETL